MTTDSGVLPTPITIDTAAASAPLISVKGLTKTLSLGTTPIFPLRDVSFDITRGEIVSIVGPSGSGKSTLLSLLGGLDSPSEGSILIDGVDITRLSERKLTRFRSEKIGFVFQSFNLVATLNARENVLLPMEFAAKQRRDRGDRANQLLEQLGLGERIKHRASQMSGGEQQRVAIARALANQPPLLLADEPTGNLDSAATETVLTALKDVREKLGTTLVIVTHNPEIARRTDRTITLVDGRVATIVTHPPPPSA